MPFLHWFKKTPQSAETGERPNLSEKLVKTSPGIASTDEPAPELQREPPTPSPQEEQTGSQTRPLPGEAIVVPVTAEGTIVEPPTTPYLSVPLRAFFDKLPAHLLAAKTPDLTLIAQIAEDDAVVDRDKNEATVPLSVLSLSCPEIFARAVTTSDDAPITFPYLTPGSEEHAPDLGDGHAESGAVLHSDPRDSRSEGDTGKVGQSAANEIKIRLQPVLADFPPDLASPAIRSLEPKEAEVSLPLDTIKAQLPNGRVTVPASTFSDGLPADLKPLFAAIDPAAEIHIPLREIFSRLPADAIEIRKDQELDRPEDKVLTPFTEHAEEDAKRFAQPSAESTPKRDDPKIEPAANEAVAVSDRLQAIFMTDAPLDLTATIRKIAALPGLKSCSLNTLKGQRLAGEIGDPNLEKVISSLLPELFQRTDSVLDELRAGALEAITIYAGTRQFSAFVRGNLCLTVVHDKRSFKPGVREKIQLVLNELEALSVIEKSS
jgi:hypothetical protein